MFKKDTPSFLLGIVAIVVISVWWVGGCTMPRTTTGILKKHRQRRNIVHSREQTGKATHVRSDMADTFVVQKHVASNLHYDFRLAIGGVLASWAVPKGPPQRAGIKRLAVATEDHPIEYASFERSIPEGEYGAGTVEIWDKGTYSNIKRYEDGTPIPMKQCLKNGIIKVALQGTKLRGTYALVRMQTVAKNNWLLMKMYQ